MMIKVNGRPVLLNIGATENENMPVFYDDVVRWSRRIPGNHYSVIWATQDRQGILAPGQSVMPESGMAFTVVGELGNA